MIKTQKKLGIEENYLNVIKAIYNKPTANIIPISEKNLRSTSRLGCPLSPPLLKILLEILDREIRKEKEIKGIRIGKEKVKLFLFGDGMDF